MAPAGWRHLQSARGYGVLVRAWRRHCGATDAGQDCARGRVWAAAVCARFVCGWVSLRGSAPSVVQVCLGLVYGMGAVDAAKKLKISVHEAQRIKTRVFSRRALPLPLARAGADRGFVMVRGALCIARSFPDIAKFTEHTRAFARANGACGVRRACGGDPRESAGACGARGSGVQGLCSPWRADGGTSLTSRARTMRSARTRSGRR